MNYGDLTTEQRNAAAYMVAGHENRTEALRRAAKAWRSWAKLYEEKGEAALDELRSHIDKKIKELQAAQGNTTRIMHAREQIVMNGGPTDSLIYQLKSATHDHGVTARSLALQRQRLNLLYGLINRIEMHGDAEPPGWLAMFDEGAVDSPEPAYVSPLPRGRVHWKNTAASLCRVLMEMNRRGFFGENATTSDIIQDAEVRFDLDPKRVKWTTINETLSKMMGGRYNAGATDPRPDRTGRIADYLAEHFARG